jgi:flap endonuclease-1
MGIKSLTKVIADNTGAIKEQKLDNYFGRKVAIDASMTLYQFMIAVRSGGETLTNENGEVTSHLQGLFSRSIRFLEMGIKPVYVFDGKPPKAKSGELEMRRAKNAEAKAELEKATEAGDAEAIEKYKKMSVRVSKSENEDCKRLLRLMGMPVVEAPCEAEAQCAELCKGGLVYATATEDMDALTFGSPILLRHFTQSEAKKQPILQFTLATVLQELGFTMEEFTDLCILLGCDYANTVKGVGPVKALELIRKYRTLEKCIESLDKSKYGVPENLQAEIESAREEFARHEVTPASEVELKWGDCDEKGLTDFLVTEKCFNEDRVKNGIAKLKKMRSTSTQGRMDQFFKAMPSTGPTATQKRKALEQKAKAAAKKTKGGPKSSWGKKKK